jgi:hypothetical protein
MVLLVPVCTAGGIQDKSNLEGGRDKRGLEDGDCSRVYYAVIGSTRWTQAAAMDENWKIRLQVFKSPATLLIKRVWFIESPQLHFTPL